MPKKRKRIFVRGVVQGVGFRPFIYRLAFEKKLTGWVNNNTRGVTIEIEGEESSVDSFLKALPLEKPKLSSIVEIKTEDLELSNDTSFLVRESEAAEGGIANLLPDLSTCAECLEDIRDPSNRRYRYPFTNCTNCGPRYSIVMELPYDRSQTSMRSFKMCADCSAEYRDPLNRRFHAQPNACPTCGPQLELCNAKGEHFCNEDSALKMAASLLRSGSIVALKGLGGFQILVNALDSTAVTELRRRKRRPTKPFAVMFLNQEMLRKYCLVAPEELDLLLSPQSPIVLLPKGGEKLCDEVSVKSPCIGAMLPYTPLHHLLSAEVQIPFVATSGNFSEEPICIDEAEALHAMEGVADYFLVHNRPIVRALDDSIVRMIAGKPRVLRRARGYAPEPVHLNRPLPEMLAVGGQMKNTVAVSKGSDIYMSQHLGDLENPKTFAAFEEAIESLKTYYQLKPETIIADLHPNYASTRYAEAKAADKIVQVQHHIAHLFSAMAEIGHEAPALGICFDGTGYGTDGDIWGGEFLAWDRSKVERVGSLRSYPLIGSQAAVLEPRRVAFALLEQIGGFEKWASSDFRAQIAQKEVRIFRQMIEKKLQCPQTSSAGRLFDGAAALLGLCQNIHFEGEAAMALEFAAAGGALDLMDPGYSFQLQQNVDRIEIDWRPLIQGLLEDPSSVSVRAWRFHRSLAEAILAVCKRQPIADLFLSGGVFQNRLLTEMLVALVPSGYCLHLHEKVPPNDGGLALGQIYYKLMTV